MKLHLFAIRDTHTNKPVEGQLFASKPEAKRARDKLNQEGGAESTRYVVTPGPDHRKSKSRS